MSKCVKVKKYVTKTGNGRPAIFVTCEDTSCTYVTNKEGLVKPAVFIDTKVNNRALVCYEKGDLLNAVTFSDNEYTLSVSEMAGVLKEVTKDVYTDVATVSEDVIVKSEQLPAKILKGIHLKGKNRINNIVGGLIKKVS